jgi:hypothetical protein
LQIYIEMHSIARERHNSDVHDASKVDEQDGCKEGRRGKEKRHGGIRGREGKRRERGPASFHDII